MEIVRERAAMARRARSLRDTGRRLGFVPTMGALHAGHLSLLEHARPGCDLVAASIFVNPLQFGPHEDLERYPRDLDGDLAQLEGAGCDLVFAPQAGDLLDTDARTFVEVAGLSDVLCGASRPGHFRGVTTIVTKLFHLLLPEVAVFGQKDAQQALVLRRMVRDLDFPVTLRIAPIRRDPDGLAMSSRNAYLTPEERREALLLHESLAAATATLERGERHAASVTRAARNVLERGSQLRIDYVEAVDTATLVRRDSLAGTILVAVAAWVGKTRLIDNVVLRVSDDAVRPDTL